MRRAPTHDEGKRDGEAGFSLLEVLVVLAMLATMAGVTMLSFNAADRGDRPEAEARLFAGRLSLASDEALLGGSALSLRVDETGYGVDAWSDEDGEWHPHSSRLFGDRHEVPRGIEMTVEPRFARIAIAPDGAGRTSAVTFRGEGEAWRVVHDGLTPRAEAVAP